MDVSRRARQVPGLAWGIMTVMLMAPAWAMGQAGLSTASSSDDQPQLEQAGPGPELQPNQPQPVLSPNEPERDRSLRPDHLRRAMAERMARRGNDGDSVRDRRALADRRERIDRLLERLRQNVHRMDRVRADRPAGDDRAQLDRDRMSRGERRLLGSQRRRMNRSEHREEIVDRRGGPHVRDGDRDRPRLTTPGDRDEPALRQRDQGQFSRQHDRPEVRARDRGSQDRAIDRRERDRRAGDRPQRERDRSRRDSRDRGGRPR